MESPAQAVDPEEGVHEILKRWGVKQQISLHVAAGPAPRAASILLQPSLVDRSGEDLRQVLSKDVADGPPVAQVDLSVLHDHRSGGEDWGAFILEAKLSIINLSILMIR